MLSNFSDTLMYLRQRNGMSQQELAEKSGCSRSAIGMYETGRREPDLETLETFADIFNVNMDFLTGRVESSEWSMRFRETLRKIVDNAEHSDLLATGLDLNEISLIVSGASRLTFDYACDIVDSLGVSFDYMLGREGQEMPIPASKDGRDAEFIELFAQLTPDEKALLCAQIRGIVAGR